MTLWRLEVLRLVRTRRWLPVVGLLLISGFLSPLTARYFTEFLEDFGPPGLQVTAPPAAPADGMREFVGNALQLGVLSLVLVAASSLAIDSQPEIAIFFRTRVRSMAQLVIPKYVVMSVMAAAAFVLGSLAAWYETEILLGSLPIGRTLIGIATGALFQCFVVAVVVFAAGWSKNFIQAAILAVVLVFTLPVIEIFDAVRPWLPSRLAANLLDVDRARTFVEYMRPVLVTLIAIPLLIYSGIRKLEQREL